METLKLILEIIGGALIIFIVLATVIFVLFFRAFTESEFLDEDFEDELTIDRLVN